MREFVCLLPYPSARPGDLAPLADVPPAPTPEPAPAPAPTPIPGDSSTASATAAAVDTASGSATAPAVDQASTSATAPVVDAATAEADGTQHAAAQEGYNFQATNQGHNNPSPAVEPIHGGTPWIIFNLAAYADHHYAALAERPNFAGMSTSDNLPWASEYTARHPGHDAEGLAKAMTIARLDSALTMPKALSFFNHMTFFGSIALLGTAFLLLAIGRRRPDEYKPRNGLQHIIEAMVLFVRDDIVRPNMQDGDPWTPYFASLFMAILAMNLFGMIPIAATPTGNLAVTMAFALSTFVLMIVLGIKNNGPLHFWLALVPVKWSWNPIDMIVYLLLLPLEVLSLFTRPAILGLRLFANMFAGHTVLLVFLSLGFIIHENHGNLALAHGMGGFGWLLAVPLYGLELFVAFIQAYIFTLLSVIFISQCAHPEH